MASYLETNTLTGHTDTVYCVCVYGDRIVSGSNDMTLKVWNPSTGTCLKTLTGHTTILCCVCVHGDTIVSGSRDKTLKVWNPSTGTCLKTLKLTGHEYGVNCVCVHGDTIVSGSADKTLKVWNPSTGTCLKTLTGHTREVECVCVHGDTIVSGSGDKTLKVWNPSTGTCLKTLTGHTAVVNCVCVHGDTIVSGSSDKTLKVWKPSTGTCLKTLTGHTHFVKCVCVHGDTIVSGSYDDILKVWNPSTGTCLKTLTGHTDAVICVCVHGDTIVSGSGDKTLKVWKHQGSLQTRATSQTSTTKLIASSQPIKYKWKYFLSHKQDEASVFAEILRQKFGEQQCWLDVYMDDKSAEAMEHGVKNSEYFVCILSNSYFKSTWCLKEARWAIQYKRPIISTYAKGCNVGAVLSEAPADLRGFQNVDSIELDRDPRVLEIRLGDIKDKVKAGGKVIKEGKVPELVTFLQELKLEQFAVKLENEGAESKNDLRELSEKDLKEALATVGMNALQINKVKKALHN